MSETGRIVKNPESQSVANGGTVDLSVSAPGATAYQWQYSTDGSTWNSSATWREPSVSFTMTPAYDGRMYRCVVTFADGSETSTPALIRLAPASDANELDFAQLAPVAQQIADQASGKSDPGEINYYQFLNLGQGPAVSVWATTEAVVAGSAANFVCHVAHEDPANCTFQWFASSDNGDTYAQSSETGANTSILAIQYDPSMHENAWYYCRVTLPDGTQLATNPLKFITQ